jgi:hypothetical protein
MNKENVIYTHHGDFFSHKEERNVVCRKMEIITLSKISQTWENKYCI